MTGAGPLPPGLAKEILAIVGPKGCRTAPGDMAPFLEERRGELKSAAGLVALPATTAQTAAIVALCARQGVAMIPQGGNTGLVGGTVATAADIIVNLSRMNRIRAMDAENDTMTVEAGCILADLQAAAAKAGRLFPLSLASEGSCQIGGNLSTNAGGTAVLRYGTARDLVLGLEVVLPDGQILDSLRGLRKDNTGYDLKQLFIGAEGTLGIITAAVCKLFPAPGEVQTALAALPSAQAAMELLTLAQGEAGETLTSFELMSRRLLGFALDHVPGNTDPLAQPHDWYVLIELSTARKDSGLQQTLERVLGRALDQSVLDDAVVAASEAQRQALWRLRETAPEAQKQAGASLKHDISLPRSRIAGFIAEANSAVAGVCPGVRPVVFGHLGDGNLHYNLSIPLADQAGSTERRAAFLAGADQLSRIVHDLVDRMGGSISAEHGLGLVKKAENAHYKSATEMDLMGRIKAEFDPRNLMNPGKVL